jgi:hypothetical protein
VTAAGCNTAAITGEKGGRRAAGRGHGLIGTKHSDVLDLEEDVGEGSRVPGDIFAACCRTRLCAALKTPGGAIPSQSTTEVEIQDQLVVGKVAIHVALAVWHNHRGYTPARCVDGVGVKVSRDVIPRPRVQLDGITAPF